MLTSQDLPKVHRTNYQTSATNCSAFDGKSSSGNSCEIEQRDAVSNVLTRCRAGIDIGRRSKRGSVLRLCRYRCMGYISYWPHSLGRYRCNVDTSPEAFLYRGT